MRCEVPKAMKMKKELVNDKLAYIDSVAKQDLVVFESVLNHLDGSGNVLRLFIGASVSMPTRALTYLASAARTAQLLPVRQLQVVSVGALGSHINKADRGAVRDEFSAFSRLGSHIIGQRMPDIASKLVFAEDTLSAIGKIEDIRPLVADKLRGNPTLLNSLGLRGEKHGGDPISYTAAHVVYQDTAHLELVHVMGQPELVVPERVISVGCLQEKLFFAARLAVRAELDEAELMPSVQIFSLHSSAPYFPSRDGEQLLQDALATRSIDFTATNISAQRDLQHFQEFLTRSNHNE